MRLSRQFQVCLFFLRKDIKCTKSTKPKINSFHPLRSFCARKTRCLCCFCALIFVLLVGFCLISVFVHSRCFRKKKNKQTWNCLDNIISLYYWRVPLSTHLWRIYLHILIFICENLFSFMITCENLFVSVCVCVIITENPLKPFLLVKTSFYLCSFVKNLFLFMLICENLFY